MSNLIVKGGNTLNGEITPAGNKNSALPILCASLLTNEEVIIHNLPDLTDVCKLVELMESIGSKIEWNKEDKTIKIDNSKVRKSFGKEAFPLGMRGSILLFGPLVTRMRELEILPNIGGCALGIRELDPHLQVLQELGVKIRTNGTIHLKAPSKLKAGTMWQDYMSVTTTENFVMAASLADGKSVMVNSASEPHVQDLCNFLIKMGAKIDGVGTSTLTVTGVDKLHSAEFTISSDHHEITTLLALGAMTGGNIRVNKSEPQFFPLINNTFKKFGVDITYDKDTAVVKDTKSLKIVEPYTKNMLPKVEAAPWPYFPTDLMPLMIALAVKSKGNIMFWNKLFEGGLFWTNELTKFGAQIFMSDPHRIIVFGGKKLHPAEVDAPNIIRATVALMMVALTIKGESKINNADSIKRAHPYFIENLQKLGADIRWED